MPCLPSSTLSSPRLLSKCTSSLTTAGTGFSSAARVVLDLTSSLIRSGTNTWNLKRDSKHTTRCSLSLDVSYIFPCTSTLATSRSTDSLLQLNRFQQSYRQELSRNFEWTWRTKALGTRLVERKLRSNENCEYVSTPSTLRFSIERKPRPQNDGLTNPKSNDLFSMSPSSMMASFQIGGSILITKRLKATMREFSSFMSDVLLRVLSMTSSGCGMPDGC